MAILRSKMVRKLSSAEAKSPYLEVVISYFGGGGIKVDILVASGFISGRITSACKEQAMADI